VRGEYDELKKQGQHRTVLHIIFESPGRFVFYLLVIGLILYFSIVPFLSLGS